MFYLKRTLTYSMTNCEILLQNIGDEVKIKKNTRNINLLNHIIENGIEKKDFNKNKICRLLLKNFFLQENNNTTNKNHLFFEYSTNTLFEENTRKLEKKILIFGIGGLGSNILYQLAQIGFKNFVIIDDDIINLSDLNKNCLFNINDVGKKTIFLKHKIFRDF